VSGGKRSPLLPNVPTFAEAGFANVDAPNWFGMFGPAGLSGQIVDKLSAELTAILHTPAFRDKFLAPRAFEGVGGNAAEFARFLAEDRKRGAELVKISGARLD
jgi:tripartite-type tricarboxylate transporter receptor subunit TctC